VSTADKKLPTVITSTRTPIDPRELACRYYRELAEQCGADGRKLSSDKRYDLAAKRYNVPKEQLITFDRRSKRAR
jgi:hypothetical protein